MQFLYSQWSSSCPEQLEIKPNLGNLEIFKVQFGHFFGITYKYEPCNEQCCNITESFQFTKSMIINDMSPIY